MGTIKVMGYGEVTITPDVTRVTVEVKDRHDTYQEAFAQGVSNTNVIKSILADNGIDGAKVKTSRFEVEKNRVSHKDKNGNWDWVVEGYNIRQTFTIELEMGSPVLTKILEAVGTDMRGAEVGLSFVVGDSVSARLKVVEAAVKDAHAKARVIATALGRSLGEVKSISYGAPTEEHYVTESCEAMSSPGVARLDADVDITPRDMTGYSQVLVEWSIA